MGPDLFCLWHYRRISLEFWVKQMLRLKSPADQNGSSMYSAFVNCAILPAELLRAALGSFFLFIFFSLNILGAGWKHSWVLWGGSWNQSTSFSVVTVILDISCNLSVLWVPTTRLEIKKCKSSLLHMLELLWSSCRTFPLAVGNVQIEFANGDFHLSSAQGCCSLVGKNKLKSISWANVWSALLDISTTSRWYTLCWPEACRTFLTS